MSGAVENPCRPDCERRCAGCHAKCPEYHRYEAYKKGIYATRAKVSAMKGQTPGRRATMRKADRDKRDGYRHK